MFYKVWRWNWGWYHTTFATLEQAEYNYVQEKQLAKMAIRPMPYVTDQKGNKIEFEWEKDNES